MATYFEQRKAEIKAELAAKASVVAARFVPAPPRPEVVATSPGYVYFFRAGNRVKIGYSTNLQARAKSLQTACHEKAFMAKFVKGSRKTEKDFHKRFDAYRAVGEWFDLEGTLAKYLEMHIRPVDLPGPMPPREEVGYF